MPVRPKPRGEGGNGIDPPRGSAPARRGAKQNIFLFFQSSRDGRRAKKEEKDPLDGKEQARRYAQSQNARFILLSNGNLHYFWDLERGNPEIITEFPTRESLLHRLEFTPNNKRLADEKVETDYIATTQNPNFKEDPRYQDETARAQYLYDEGLPILRPYQLKAIQALQRTAEAGNDRFLFEMATGTGKTLVSGAVINSER